MSFELTNAPMAFLDLTNWVFCHFLDLFIIVFIDEVLVNSKSKVDQTNHICIVLHTLKDQRLMLRF